MKSILYTRIAMVFTAILMFTFIATSQTTISVLSRPVYNNEERASDVGGDVVGSNDFESSDLEIVFDAETQFVGMIFRDLAIPVGATITNAYIQFTVDDLSPGTTDAAMPPLTIYGAKEANVPDPFTDVLFTVSSHPQTTAQVTNWMPGPSVAVGDAGVNEQTPDISTIIAEIIALDGWTPGNSIMIVITADPALTENINREMESSNGGDADKAPVLWVTFTEGGGTAVNPIRTEFTDLVYPNPTEGVLNIENPSTDKFSYKIYSINGKLVASRRNLTGSTTQVDLSSFAKGAYFVDVITAGKTETLKVILK